MSSLAALKKDKIALLDWGGGIGHYCLLSRCILPELLIEYSCKDLPMLCTAGRELLTEATFYEADDEIAGRHYDLVLASGSLQCAEDWKSVIRLLVGSASPYLFVTRLPVVRHCRSFVVRQRAYAYGYESEYFSWIFNREEVIDTVVSEGCELVREFLFHEHPHVSCAPEQAEVRGFLFRNRYA
jgi:putative methyltransferase (TIGR04325 family)